MCRFAARECTPHFLCLRQRKRAVHGPKEKRFWGSNFVPLGQSWTDGSWRSNVPPGPEIFCRVRRTEYEGRSTPPHFGGVDANLGWSTEGLQQQAPLPLPGPVKPAAARVDAGPCGLCPAKQFQFAWQKAKRFSKTVPAPNAEFDNDHHGLLLGPPYFKQIRREAPFCAQAISLWTVHGPFLFFKKKRNGGCIPVRQSRTSPRPARGRNPSPLVRAPQQIFRGHSKIIRQGA